MGKHDYFQLVPPLTVLLFACAFLAVWRYDRQLRGSLVFAVSYLFAAIGLTTDFFLLSRDGLVPVYSVNAPYVLASSLFAVGMFQRFELPPLRWLIWGVPAVVLVAFAFLSGPGYLTARLWLIYASATLLLGLPAILAWPKANGQLVRVMLILVLVTASQYVVRMGLLIGEGWTPDVATFGDTMLANVTRFLTSIGAMCVATVLLMLYAMDIVRGLTRNAEIDPLTELLNRRGLDAAVAGPDGIDRRNGVNAVIIADIDQFKLVNDTYGHAAGDEAIRSFARLLRENVRGSDIVARLGGEEFVVVLPGATLEMARLAAEGVRTALAAQPMPVIGGKAITSSFGVAAWPPGVPLVDALGSADEALYKAKSGGRDRVVTAPPIRAVHGTEEGKRADSVA